jgi:hypothetical protein
MIANKKCIALVATSTLFPQVAFAQNQRIYTGFICWEKADIIGVLDSSITQSPADYKAYWEAKKALNKCFFNRDENAFKVEDANVLERRIVVGNDRALVMIIRGRVGGTSGREAYSMLIFQKASIPHPHDSPKRIAE